MDTNSFDFIMDNYKGIKRDRALKIATNQLGKGDKEYCQYMKNELVTFRRSIIKYYKTIEKLSKYREEHMKDLKFWQENRNIIKEAETQLIISEIDEVIQGNRSLIARMGGLVAHILGLNILSEHEVCQLFNINAMTWKKKRGEFLSNCEGKQESDNLISSVIVIKGPEYRALKCREKGVYDCPDYEMPIYWAMHEEAIEHMRTNEEFREAAREKFKQLYPDLKSYKVVKDLEGNIIEVIENE